MPYTNEDKRVARQMNREIAARNPPESVILTSHDLRLSVNTMCYQCQAETGPDEERRQRIGACQKDWCGLFAVRPYQPNHVLKAGQTFDAMGREAYAQKLADKMRNESEATT